SGRDVDHVVLANDVALSFHDERALPALDDIDIVGVAMVMQLAAGTAGNEPIEVNVDLLGAKTGIDQLDLLAASGLHGDTRTLAQLQDLEHPFVPPCRKCASHALSRDRNLRPQQVQAREQAEMSA